MLRALIVDDDVENLHVLSDTFRGEGFAVETADSLPKAREALLARMPEVAMLSERVNGDDVLALLEAVDLAQVMEIYLMSNTPSVRGATRAMRVGASDYFRKPVDRARLQNNLDHFCNEMTVDGEGRPDVDDGGGGLLVGRSTAMRRLYRLVRKCAPSDVTVLLVGESGTGKELVAQTIHQFSERAGGEFVALNCSAVTPELMESEMFGHKKGSFTGAARDHKGYFERASDGTLFLDEITEMSPGLQAKLLRALEVGRISPVGSECDVEVNPRIVAATNQDPAEAISTGQLREDLYYRLAQFPISVPPLRDRTDDIRLLAEHFLEDQNRASGLHKRFAPRVLESMQTHDWPGNVRELKNAVLHGFLLGGDEITTDDLPGSIPSRVTPSGDFIRVAIGSPLSEVERRLVLATLEHFNGDKKHAARVLGISLKTLYNRLKAYNDS
jgi:two-component system, NtrC family, response regulator AtoC